MHVPPLCARHCVWHFPAAISFKPYKNQFFQERRAKLRKNKHTVQVTQLAQDPLLVEKVLGKESG